MPAAFEFTYETSEMDFGSFCLGGDFFLTLSTDDDGFSFKLIDAESCGSGVSKAAFAVIQEWVDDDTAPRARGSEHKSLVRQAYTDALIERDENRADDRGCHEYHQMRGGGVMARFLFWVSALLLPVNLYFVAFGTISPVMSAAAAALNIVTMIQMRGLV